MNPAFSLGGLPGAVGIAVLHFLWQGLVIGMLAAAALRGCGRNAPQARYCVALAALGACVLVFLATLVSQLGHSASVTAHSGEVATGAASPSLWGSLLRSETVSVLWCCGVLVLAARLALQLAAARRLSWAASTMPPEQWVEVFERIKARLGVDKAVRLIEHASIDTPMVVGWFAPVVLVPAAALASLTPDQLYAVLAHELAHIRRRDHLINAIQAVVEVALFFHPVVWWLSSMVRVEREHCCDDVAVGAAASPLVFAEALAQLEALRQVFPQAAVAANGGSLMDRIERVLKIDKSPSKSLRWGGAAAIITGAVIVAAALAQASAQPAAAPEPAPATSDERLLVLVTPTIYVEPGDDEQEASPDEDGNYLIELSSFSRVEPVYHYKVALTLSQAEHDDIVRKQALEQAANTAVEELRRVAADIEAAVADGLITREDADKRLAELKAQAAERGRLAPPVQEKMDAAGGDADRQADAVRDEIADINAAVEAGAITRAAADELMQAVKKKEAEREAQAKEAARRLPRR